MKQKDRKAEQLQIRVSMSQKRAIREQAREAGMSMSDWVLSRVVPPVQEQFQSLLVALAGSDVPSHEFAELLEFLGSLGAHEYEVAVTEPPRVQLDPYWNNYVAATIEHTAAMKSVPAPFWTQDVQPLEEPAFGSDLQSVRYYLLTHSPPAFSERNIFIDSTVGDRV